jgi:hypothetical protein
VDVDEEDSSEEEELEEAASVRVTASVVPEVSAFP